MTTAADRLNAVYDVMGMAAANGDTFGEFLDAFQMTSQEDKEAFGAFVSSMALYLSEAMLADPDVAHDGTRATTALVMAGFHAGALYAARLDLEDAAGT